MKLPYGKEKVINWLRKRDANEGLIEFASNYDTLSDIWKKCCRAEYMIWLLNQIDYKNDKKLRLYSCWCVENTHGIILQPAWATALELSKLYAEGKISYGLLFKTNERIEYKDLPWRSPERAMAVAVKSLLLPGVDVFTVVWNTSFIDRPIGQAATLRKMIGNPFKKPFQYFKYWLFNLLQDDVLAHSHKTLLDLAVDKAKKKIGIEPQ
mgnify:CR=1 FL=1